MSLHQPALIPDCTDVQARKAREAGTNPKELEVTAQPGAILFELQQLLGCMSCLHCFCKLSALAIICIA